MNKSYHNTCDESRRMKGENETVSKIARMAKARRYLNLPHPSLPKRGILSFGKMSLQAPTSQIEEAG
jgi:hypothetical protein